MKRADLWLSYAWNDSLGGFLAIASTKHPSLGDSEVDVVAASLQRTESDCIDWFDNLRPFSPGATFPQGSTAIHTQ